MREVKVRIAPSPTGDPHVGTAYIALFNYVFAKHNNGKFILRIEDTDRTRSTEDSEQQIFDALKWLGLNYDEGPDVGGEFGPYRQSERFDIYKKYALELVEKGAAYYCFCTQERLKKLRERQIAMKKAPGYDGHCRSLTKEEVEANLKEGKPYVIRLKMPYEGKTVIKDLLRGEVSFENDKIDDQILLKSDGFPTYHLANVVDDHLMGITHVIRAEEWIPSTPKHIQLYKAFGWEEPVWVHMPLLRNADKSKISKRKNPVSLNYYIETGYLKEGILNFLALMGWGLGEEKEMFGLDEMIEKFTFDRASLGGPVFDLKKLGWLNNLHMRNKDLGELTKLAIPYFVKAGYLKDENMTDEEFENLKSVIKIAREPSQTLSDLPKESKIYFVDDFMLPEVEEGMFAKQKKTIVRLHKAIEDEIGKKAIQLFIEKIEKMEENISEEDAKNILHSLLDEIGEGAGKILMPIRAVLTGEPKGPDLYTVINVIGKTRVLKRVNNIVEKYNLK
ncbi:glutamate--tRNA ligase [Haliovirga abyssi]|uniref:Glutamate--tRNA ligase n=1 Tax=Haliovirga abyssi TaxID=2996794 RepID=A0AAU9DC98_9FUSO|nr:glutamate--tRNA ligase [Haliovirga abyssi]BDU49763.1 glutamate--tRNA ligase [Haliovirga abyssi]